MGAAALIFGAGPFTEKTWARPLFSSYPFSLGVASGDPLSDGVVLWTRLAPDPLKGGGMPKKSVSVQWEVANDGGFSDVIQKGVTYAYPELAHTVHVEVGGLAPSREYFYRFKAGSEISPVGRTKTAPALGANVAEMAFAFVSCQMYEHGYYTAYRRMAELENLDLVVHLGDYIYEYGPNVYKAQSGNVRTHSGPETITLSDYRNRHAQYKTDADLQAAHAAFPWVVTWDDHEVENNYADEIPSPSSQTPTTEEFLRRRAAAYQAYYEHMPLRRTSVPSGPDMLLYRRIAYGNLAEFNVLDTRQYRDDQAAGELYAMDPWDGYWGSRDRILDYIGMNQIQNPVVLTGDVHNSWASELKANFYDPNSATLGVEFVGSAVTSGGDGAGTSDTQEEIIAENPHIKFFNGQRGYVRCRLTPQEWRTDYRVLPFVSQPDQPISTKATFAVQAGNPSLQQVYDAAPVGVAVSSALIESDAERMRAQREADRSGRR